MASSDEEGEIVPDCVTNYHFVDDKDAPVSFSVLPLQWCDDDMPDLKIQIFLRGTADSGHQIYKKVIAWKSELSRVLPEIYVLSKEKSWIKLQRPRRSFEDTIQTILITVHCLHFLKRNRKADGSALWNHLRKAFSSYEVEPCESHLLCHIPLLEEAARRDKDIANSEYASKFLLDISSKDGSPREEVHTSKKSEFIVDMYDDDSDVCDENDIIFSDSVCALCDNGGELLCCENKCLRSFHPNVDAGAESFCESLGYCDAQVEAMQTFLCNNCQYQQHQCFVCGNLGSSDQSCVPEVFQCANANCGYFYHPECVALLVHPCNKTKAKDLQQAIVSGESFVCPAHKCTVCKQGEDKADYDLQFAICRRCPKAYHRKCLPREIAFKSNDDKNIQQRAWEGLLSDWILIYCIDHKIIPEIGTPKRNHILFPNVDGKKETASGLLSSEETIIKSKIFGNCTLKRPLRKGIQVPSLGDAFKYNHSTTGDCSTSKIFLRHNDTSTKARSSNMNKSKLSLGNNLPESTLSTKYLPKSSQTSNPDFNSNNLNIIENAKRKAYCSQSAVKEEMKSLKGVLCRRSPVDEEMKTRILKLMKDSISSLKVDEVLKDQKMSSILKCGSQISEDKTFTEGKVEGYVKAVRAALQILDCGGTLEEAKAVCEPQVLNQIFRWKRALRVYLAPVLHGKRYTSFGRHFTKVDKLKEIAERLKWYIQDGDTIVDFCCGSNDFSCLVKEKLDKMGKRCSFRNYDLITPKKDFNFEQRDWMSVDLKELPAGSSLIMGLNPPFGVNASLANMFINRALTFKPKLLILIVPKEAHRLDRKRFPYNIIWEDDQLLSGKSFYLPGSVDVKDQQLEQWNLDAPPLYLWSRPDWTSRHKAIAQKCGHLGNQPWMSAENIRGGRFISNYLMEEKHDCYVDFSDVLNVPGELSTILDDIPDDFDGIGAESHAAVPTHVEGVNQPSSYHGLGYNRPPFQIPQDMKREQIDTSQTRKMDMEVRNEGMCVNMELESPLNSPSKHQKNSRNNEQGDFRVAPGLACNRRESFQHIQSSHYTFETGNAAFPSASQIGNAAFHHHHINESSFAMSYQWPTGATGYFNSGYFNPRGPGC